ncbi:MAG: SAM-dependent methyltransferase [Flavobacteriales bacterium]|nr:SAM-dependent methyltransferase [Flavobacteriales bacterium]
MPSNTYWDNRYNNNDIGWDIGKVSNPIKYWLDSQIDRSKKILIPGAGSGFEAGYAYAAGFKNVYYLDFSTVAAKKFKTQFPDFPPNQILANDYFNLSNFNDFFDVIIEQTFFCAISPNKRVLYINKAYELLEKNGKIVGLLFNVNFNEESPPFGGSKEDYELLFKTKFNILKLEACYNSVSPRLNNELWISLQKP